MEKSILLWRIWKSDSLQLCKMKEKSQRPTHQSEVYNILQHEPYPRRRLPLFDDFFHLVKILIHPRLVRHRGREMVNLRCEGHVQHVSIQSTRQHVAGVIILQSWPIVQFITWNSPEKKTEHFINSSMKTVTARNERMQFTATVQH